MRTLEHALGMPAFAAENLTLQKVSIIWISHAPHTPIMGVTGRKSNNISIVFSVETERGAVSLKAENPAPASRRVVYPPMSLPVYGHPPVLLVVLLSASVL